MGKILELYFIKFLVFKLCRIFQSIVQVKPSLEQANNIHTGTISFGCNVCSVVSEKIFKVSATFIIDLEHRSHFLFSHPASLWGCWPGSLEAARWGRGIHRAKWPGAAQGGKGHVLRHLMLNPNTW